MAVLLHLSDPHFGTERPAVVEALLDHVAAAPPDTVVISGDITQRARAAQFAAALAFVARLRALAPAAPVLVLPGNHDIPLFDLRRRLFAPFAGFRRAFGALLEPCHEDDGLLLQLVNTVTRWRHTDGVVRADQIERVAHRLAVARPGQLRVVVTHQPAAVMRRADRPDLLRNADAAIRRWGLAGADLLLGGHIHLPYVCGLAVAGAAGPRRLWVAQAGTAVSHRIRHEAGNSFNLIRYGAAVPQGCVVERWDYDEAARRFACQVATPLPLDREFASG